jgi:glycosyltransferase involved in cell wall biosynthesis
MRSIVICSTWPWAHFGGPMRLRLVCQTLAELGSLDVFIISPEESQEPATHYTFVNRLYVVRPPMPPRPEQVRERVYAELAKWTSGRTYDLVWYAKEGNWLLARGAVRAPSIIDVDDLDDVVLQRRLEAQIRVRAPAKINHAIEWFRSVHWQAAREADLLVVASEADRRRLGWLGARNIAVVPNTYEPADSAHFKAVQEQPTILFQGLLRYPPNVDAASRLVQEIAPPIREHLPDLKIVLAGDAGDDIRRLASHPGVEVTGAVKDMAELLRSADLVVVPLRYGGGTRIKILEAFAHWTPVVSTTIGADGLQVSPGVHLEIADSAADMSASCLRLLRDADARYRLADAGYRLYLDKYQTRYGRRDILRAMAVASARHSL